MAKSQRKWNQMSTSWESTNTILWSKVRLMMLHLILNFIYIILKAIWYWYSVENYHYSTRHNFTFTISYRIFSVKNVKNRILYETDFIYLLHSKKGCCLCYSNLNSILYISKIVSPFFFIIKDGFIRNPLKKVSVVMWC